MTRPASLAEAAAALRRRAISPLELVDAYHKRIEETADLRAFITPPGEQARREARRAQQRLARGEAGARAGGPRASKGPFATRGLRATAGGRVVRGRVPCGGGSLVGWGPVGG